MEEGNPQKGMMRYLSDSEKQQITKWIQEKWSQPNCDTCGSYIWRVYDYMVAAQPYVAQGTPIDATNFPLLPQVLLVCGGCGTIKAAHAESLGLSIEIDGAVLTSDKDRP